MEDMENMFMDYLAKERTDVIGDGSSNNDSEQMINQMLRGNSYDYEDIRILSSNSSNSISSTSDWIFSGAVKTFTGLFVIMPIGVAALAGSVSGAITHVSDDVLNSYTNVFVSLCGTMTCSTTDTKIAINRFCRFITFFDAIGYSVASLFYDPDNQITIVQHTVTAIWVWTGVPAAFVAAENLMKPIYRQALANQGSN